MKTSESIVKITSAFLAAQRKIESVIKDSSNPYFNSKYADLTSVIEACKKHLNDNDIAILQPIDGMMVETILIHTSGEWFSSYTPIEVRRTKVTTKDDVTTETLSDPQAMGSAITYAKRYGLQSMVLLPAEDDDGNSASKTKEMVKATQSYSNIDEAIKNSNRKPFSIGVQKALGQVCPDCGKGKIVINPKTQKLFCDKKCWLNKQPISTADMEQELPEYTDKDIPF